MEEKILEVLRDVLDSTDIDTTCSQQTCEDWDSMRHLTLVSELEAAFGVDLTPEEMGQMKDFNAILAILSGK